MTLCPDCCSNCGISSAIAGSVAEPDLDPGGRGGNRVRNEQQRCRCAHALIMSRPPCAPSIGGTAFARMPISDPHAMR